MQVHLSDSTKWRVSASPEPSFLAVPAPLALYRRGMSTSHLNAVRTARVIRLLLQFSLVGGFLEWLCAKDESRLLVIGLPSAGKTCLMEHAKRAFTSGHRPIPLPSITRTIGVNIARLQTPVAEVTAWDVGGTVSAAVLLPLDLNLTQPTGAANGSVVPTQLRSAVLFAHSRCELSALSVCRPRKQMQNLWSRYYSDSDGVLFVFDAANRAEFDRVRSALGT